MLIALLTRAYLTDLLRVNLDRMAGLKRREKLGMSLGDKLTERPRQKGAGHLLL